MDPVAARDFWNSRYDRQDYLFGETPIHLQQAGYALVVN